MKNASKFALVWGKVWCLNSVQVLDYSIFKGVDSSTYVEVNLYPFFRTNKKLMTKGDV